MECFRTIYHHNVIVNNHNTMADLKTFAFIENLFRIGLINIKIDWRLEPQGLT